VDKGFRISIVSSGVEKHECHNLERTRNPQERCYEQGDGDTDLAVYKVEPWGGMWYIKDQAAFVWGNSASIPVPGDYNGCGNIDIAVYNDGTWYIMDQFVDNWGDALSYPLPAPDTNGDGDPWH